MKRYFISKINNAVILTQEGDTIDETMLEITEEEAQNLINPPKTDEELKAEFKAAVQTAIDKTDLVALRCWKAGIEFPTDWKEYTVALRALLSSAVVVDLPTMPEYPSGS
ncbi:MAG: hypothetical protein JW802_07015 [Campylobacterales bacterium]|nr:hypothetical protein [Campylobacterales bacterium]